MTMPVLSELQVADPPARWRELGFDVAEGAVELGGVRVSLCGSGTGITAWSLRGIDPVSAIDGLPTTVTATPAGGARGPHPNGATALDHVVVVTPDFDRTAGALKQSGLGLHRVREVPGGVRQGFRRLGPAILELVHSPQVPEGPARFWGLVVIVEDLAALAARLAPHVGAPKPAVQPGRQIATLGRGAGLSTAVAFMTPEPDGA